MPLTIIDARDMSLRVRHVKQVHIATDCRLFAYPVTVVDLCLIVTAAAKEVGTTRIERERSDWVPIERLEVFEWFQITIHGGKVPDLHSVV